MHVVGLFIGADAHGEGAADLTALTFAAGDAEAMHATFADLNDAEGAAWEPNDLMLLVGADATREGVAASCAELAKRSEQSDIDLAIVHVSGHGRPDGALVLFDTDTRDVSGTALLFDDLVRWVTAIRAQRIVIAFDVCFSGICAGIPHPGTDASLHDKLAAAARGSVAVISAARATEAAYELPSIAHGILTYGLLAGLDGTTLVRGGRIDLSAWLEHARNVAARVIQTAGLAQTPGYYLERRDGFSLPAHPVGPRRARLLARHALHAITTDPSSLQVYGLSARTVAAVSRRIRGQPLSAMQVRAVERAGVMAGRNVVVAAPTSSGKTLVGELAVLASVVRRRKSVVLLPTRALTQEKYEEFRSAYDDALGVTVVRAFGGIEDDDVALLTHQFSVAFLTYEKFLGLVFARPHLLETLGTVVIDEVHMLGDGNRGWNLELLLTLLRHHTQSGASLQVVALSAALGSLNGFETWLGAELVHETTRPVPLREGVLSPSGRFRYRDEHTGELCERQWITPLPASAEHEFPDARRRRLAGHLAAEVLRDSSECVLAFCADRRGTRGMAEMLAGVGLPAATSVDQALAGHGDARDDGRATRLLRACLARGAAFHIGDLDNAERQALEEGFRNGQLRALAATSGLAMGVNTPASTVIIVDHDRFVGSPPNRPYAISEYRNMAGRAGRWLTDQVARGVAVLIAHDEMEVDTLVAHFVCGDAEPLLSQGGTLAMEDVTLGLLGIMHTTGPTEERRLREVLDGTFFAFLTSHDTSARTLRRGKINTALVQLASAGFIARDVTSGSVTLTALGRVCAREGLCFASAQRILTQTVWPETATGVGGIPAAAPWANEMTLLVLAQLTDELADVWMPAEAGELVPWTAAVRTIVADAALIDALVGADVITACQRLKRTFAVANWARGKKVRDIEIALTTHQLKKKDEPMAGAIRRAAERTNDVVRAVAGVLAARYPSQQSALSVAVRALRPRLEAGVTGDGVPLLRWGLPLSRAQRLELVAAELTTLDTLAAAVRAALRRQPEGTVVRRVVGDAGLPRLADALARAQQRSARRTSAAEQMEHNLFETVISGAPL